MTSCTGCGSGGFTPPTSTGFVKVSGGSLVTTAQQIAAADLPVLNSSGAGYFIGPNLPTFWGLNVSSTTAVGAINTVYVSQFVLASAMTIGHVTTSVVTGSAGATGNVGIYNSAGTKLVDSGAISLAASSSRPVTPFTAVTLPPGTYYLAWAQTSLTPVVETVLNPSTALILATNANSTKYGTAANALSAGVLPSTLGALTAATTSVGVYVPTTVFEF